MNHTLREIRNQVSSWPLTIAWMNQNWGAMEQTLAIQPDTHFLYIGCGSSYFLAKSAARLHQRVTGHISIALQASEVFLAGTDTLPKGCPIVAIPISRSGTTSEVLLAIEYLKDHVPAAQIIGITCNSTSPMATMLDRRIALDHASEQSVVMTQSFTNMLLALQYASACVAKRRDLLKELGMASTWLSEHMDAFEAFGRKLGGSDEVSRLVYLGLSEYEGLAMEGMLKLKEMTQVPSEAFNPMEFRHGPISVIENGYAVILVLGRNHADFIGQVVKDVQGFGGLTVHIGPESDAIDADDRVIISPHVSEWVIPLLSIAPLQFFACYKAMYKGLNPDEPRHLAQSVII